jgi:steroid 5-alpha reductase family enzyme
MNGFVNGYGVFHLYSYDAGWIFSWQFITGTTIFITGFLINKIADSKLMHMRKESPYEYVIPRGWLFNYISSPHYMGEIIEWCGWALMTFSLPGLAFAVFTFANLLPRAIASHKWYKKQFSDYPSERKAIIPFVI